jgi:pimeloyl-ACP methyl ester carboxylesterase
VTYLFQYRLEIAGHATRVLETAGEGPGIVLLHGWTDSADGWRRVLAELDARGRRAIAVDLPGFGAATRLRSGPILPQLDAFVAELILSWAGGEDVVLAGSSLGGCLALRLADHGLGLPIAGVMPVAPAGLEPPGWHDAIERDPIVRRLLSLPIPVPTALAGAAGVEDDVLDVHPFNLGAIDCPVLMVWGSLDRHVPQTGARRALDELPSTHVHLIEGCGRHPELEAPDRLLELLLQFPGP